MIYNQLSEYLLKHLAQVQTLMMMSATSEDAGFRSITRKSLQIFQLNVFLFFEKKKSSEINFKMWVENRLGQLESV